MAVQNICFPSKLLLEKKQSRLKLSASATKARKRTGWHSSGGAYTKELFIDRRENSKSLAWSSVLLAFGKMHEVGAVVNRPKALGDIRGVTYIFGIFYRFGLIDVPENVKEKMKGKEA